MVMQDERKLPKWAQQRFKHLRDHIKGLCAMRDASIVLADHDWFTVTTATERMTLYRLCANNAVAICSIGPGDVLLVGRSMKGGDA